MLAQASPGFVLGLGRVALRPGIELLDRGGELLRFHGAHARSSGEPVSPEDHPERVTTARRLESTIRA